MDRTVTIMLLNIARQLALLKTEEVRKHVEAAEESLSRAEGFGPLLDPTAYLRDMSGGQFEDARHQLKIARHLLAARKAIDEREAFVESRTTKLGA
jgi:hypothetical protein